MAPTKLTDPLTEGHLDTLTRDSNDGFMMYPAMALKLIQEIREWRAMYPEVLQPEE